ncbi:MAG: hypothetical protein ACREEO_12670, partial [Phenylobacterium sp.]
FGAPGMELRTLDGQLTPGGVLKMIATGYLIGAGVLSFVAIAVMELSGASAVTTEGPIGKAVILLLVVPLVLGVQGLMFGALVVFGLWLLRRKWDLRVVAGDPPEPSPQP